MEEEIIIVEETPQIDELNAQIKILIEKNAQEQEKNKILINQIDALVEEQKNIQKKMDTVKEQSTLTEITIEPKIYLKGMFESFLSEQNALKILIEGREYFYPLQNYQCAHLPISGSRMLIFQSSESEPIIYGFDVAKLLPPASNIKVVIKALLKNLQKIKLYSKELGYFDVSAKESFFQTNNIKIGDELMLKKIKINGCEHLCVDAQASSLNNRDAVLEILLKAAL